MTFGSSCIVVAAGVSLNSTLSPSGVGGLLNLLKSRSEMIPMMIPRVREKMKVKTNVIPTAVP